MMQSPKGFTMIEILIVLGIVGLILGITFRISGSTITDFKVKNEIAQFSITYNNEISKLLNTNYHNQFYFTDHITTIVPESSHMIFSYQTNNTGIQQKIPLTHMKFSQTLPDTTGLTISRKPYQIGCIINNNPQILTGAIRLQTTNNTHDRCFTLSNDTCKITQNRCP